MTLKPRCRNCTHWQGAVLLTHTAKCAHPQSNGKLTPITGWCRNWESAVVKHAG